MLRFNTFRAQKYLRSKFVEGKYLLASEATDLELELIDLLRKQLKNSMGDFAVEDSWKVERLSSTQLRIKPGEAWLNGLPFNMRFGKDHLVSGSLLSAGIVPAFVSITDDSNGLGKIITFNSGGSTPTGLYKVVITAQEQIITDNDDLFLKNANLTEDTAQKIRLVHKINLVTSSIQTETPIPYTNDSNQANLVNKIVVSPTAAGNGELITTTLISGSEQIDGRNVELIIRNNPGIGGGNPIPNGSTDQQAFAYGRLIDSNGTEFALIAVINSSPSTNVVLRVSHEVGQNPPEIINGKPYSLLKRDVYVTDDVSGIPQGKVFFPIANVNFDSAQGVESDSHIADLRRVHLQEPTFEGYANQKDDFNITGGGTLTLDSSSTLFQWTAAFKVINAYGAVQTIAANTVAMMDGGTLAYKVKFAGGALERGNLAVTVATSGSVLTLSGSPSLASVRVGNVVNVGGQYAAITSIDDVGTKTLNVSPSISNTGAATIYLDSFAAGTAPLSTDSIVLAVRDGSLVKVAKSLVLNPGDTTTLGGVNSTLVRQNRNLKLINGGTWSWTAPNLVLSVDAQIQIPGLADNRNNILAQTIVLNSNDEVAWVSINRDSGAAANLAVTVTSIASLVMTDNTVIIARRLGTTVNVGTGSFLLISGESKELDAGLSIQNRTFIGAVSEADANPQYTSNGVVADNDPLNVAISKIDEVLSRPAYDEVLSFPTGLTVGTPITLPNNSRNGGAAQLYNTAAGLLQIHHNQLYKRQGVDWNAVNSSTISFNYDLPNHSEVHFRIATIGGISIGGGGGSSTLQDAYNNGNTITTSAGVPVTINGPPGKLLVVNGDVDITGVIDPKGLQLDPQASNPLSGPGIWNDTSGRLMHTDGVTPINISQTLTNVAAGTASAALTRSMLNSTGFTIPAGTPVYTNTSGHIAPATGSVDSSARVIGVTVASIADGASGLVALVGVVVGGFGSFAHGSYLYLTATPGVLTDVAPTIIGYLAGFNVVKVGIVEGSNLFLQIQHIGKL